MKSRMSHAVLLAALAVPLSGCPIPAIALGTWLLTIDTTKVGIILLDGGQTQEPIPLPPEADNVLNGTVTWEQNGRTITFTQVTGGITAVYTGTVDTSTNIVDGTWMQTVGGSASGTWVGEKLD